MKQVIIILLCIYGTVGLYTSIGSVHKKFNITNGLYLINTFGGTLTNIDLCELVSKDHYLALLENSDKTHYYLKFNCYKYDVNCYHPMYIIQSDYTTPCATNIYGNIIMVHYSWFNQLKSLDKCESAKEKEEFLKNIYEKANNNVKYCCRKKIKILNY